jgi:hypothetical protein
LNLPVFPSRSSPIEGTCCSGRRQQRRHPGLDWGRRLGDASTLSLRNRRTRREKGPSSSRVCRGQHGTAHGRARLPPWGPIHRWTHVPDGTGQSSHATRGSGSPPSVVRCGCVPPPGLYFVLFSALALSTGSPVRRVPDEWTRPRASPPKMHRQHGEHSVLNVHILSG